eukprot:CAMPEP_0197183810 /NCGR_PEP_ID=MMETSP1423-20130617/8444_1 /TAXON_ID=476441 /ORGANISM="Pseudo-nitzschia heimii, Strain UNC1101" /LENGTH=222 /DNA_ID=CAMNT_0042634445 /DNA_START=52 /DNA_END=720 /DNA_ORIENTATION=-
MTVMNAIRVCLAAAVVCKSNAFTVAPPVVAIDVPASASATATASTVRSSSSSSPSNLPSQRELLDGLGSSFTVAAGATQPKAAAVEPSAAAATTTAAPTKSTNVAKGAGISIADIFFDGKVPKTESDEYIVVQNSSKAAVDVSGYALYPATSGNQGSTFTFPKGSTIQPNASVRVYTNEIHKETGGYSYGSGRALWSNKGGVAVLKDGNGKKLGEYKYVPSS